MPKQAVLMHNATLDRWEATFEGQVVAKGGSKAYVIDALDRGNRKTRELGIDGYVEVTTGPKVKTVEFGITERFQFLEDFIEQVATGVSASALITGQGGLGKTHTVIRSLRAAGLKPIDEMEIGARHMGKRGFTVVKGNSTPKGLFRTLYENRKQVIVFDDCDSVLQNEVAANLLKAALDSYDKRVISWNSEGWGDDDLPKSFEFTGGVIFISNMPKSKIPQALMSRANVADVTMTRSEIIERMTTIASEAEFMPEYDMTIKADALGFLREHANDPGVKALNLRSLIKTIKNRATKPTTWQRLSLYSLYNEVS
jgi:hypothetical protein